MKGFIQILLLLAFFSNPSHADIFKWIDSDGKVHFSDSPPRTVAEEKIQAIEVTPVNIMEINDADDQATRNFLKEKDKERALENSKRSRSKSSKNQSAATAPDEKEKKPRKPKKPKRIFKPKTGKPAKSEGQHPRPARNAR